MALRNLKYYVAGISNNRNAAVLQQIQFEANAADPTDADLAAGRLHYKTGVGLRWYSGTTWYTIPTSGGGTISAWDDLYALDKTLTISSTTLTFALTHATGNGLTLTGSAGSSGHCIQITNSGSGNDINGTSNTWSVSKAGAGTFTTIVGCASLTAATNLALEANGAGTISIGATSSGAIDIGTGGGAITLVTDVSCSATLTVGTGITVSDGTNTFTDNSNAANGLVFVNNTVTTYGNATDAGPVHFSSTSLTTGHLLTLSLAATPLAGGSYLRCWESEGGTAVFTVGEAGLTTIAGSTSGTDALVLTAGDILVTSGNLDMTVGDFAMADGSITAVDADNAASLSITNDTATSESVIVFAGSGVFTGTTTKSWMTITPSGLATGTAVYLAVNGLTQGKGLHITGDPSQTSGTLLYVQNTGNNSAMTSGTIATFDMTQGAITGTVNKIGNGVTISSTRTTTSGTVADDFDLCSIIRTDVINGAGSMSAAGSVLYIENAVTNTSGTVTDTANGIELVMDSLGTGAGIKITHAATGGIALSIAGAATSVDDVLINTTGVKANNKGALQVANSGATAAGGSILRVINTGTPAAATSYLVDFDYSGATMTNNPTTIFINSGSSTGDALQVNGSGVGYSLATYNSNTGATGVQWFTQHTSTGSAADNDVVFSLIIGGLSDTDAAVSYASIKATAIDVSNATEDGKLALGVMVAGTLTDLLSVQSSTAGATSATIGTATATLTGAAAGTAAFTITNGDISLSAGKFISTTTADIYGLDVTVNKASATQGVAVFTNASATSAKHVLEIEQADVDEPYMKFSGATAITSANAGVNGAPPAQVQGYLLVDIDGTDRKIPYYVV